MGNITADYVWKTALGIMKKEHPIPDGGSFSHVSKVETAYNEYSVSSLDSRIKLCNTILEAYGAVYSPQRSMEYNDFASALALAAAEKIKGIQLDNLIREYTPEKSKDRSFLLYLHSALRREFYSKAEKERALMDGTKYIVSDVSRKKYREARKFTNAEFGCDPKDCTSDEFDKLLEHLNGIKGLSGTTADELKLIIEENSLRLETACEDDDKDPLDNISDDYCVDYDQEDIGSVAIKATDSQMYYFGIFTAHRFLGDYFERLPSKAGEKNLINIDVLLRSETEEMKKAFVKLVSVDFDRFSEGADVVCRIATENLQSGKGFPKMGEIAASLGLTGASVINRSYDKVVKKLADVIPH